MEDGRLSRYILYFWIFCRVGWNKFGKEEGVNKNQRNEMVKRTRLLRGYDKLLAGNWSNILFLFLFAWHVAWQRESKGSPRGQHVSQVRDRIFQPPNRKEAERGSLSIPGRSQPRRFQKITFVFSKSKKKEEIMLRYSRGMRKQIEFMLRIFFKKESHAKNPTNTG